MSRPADPFAPRPPRRSPRRGPGGVHVAPGWRVARVPADAPVGTPATVLRACAPDLADARAGLRAPAAGELSLLDVIELSPVGGVVGLVEFWFVREDGRAVPLPDPSLSICGALYFAPDFGRWLRRHEGWREVWRAGGGDVLVGMAAEAGVDPRAVLATAAAFLRHAAEAPGARAAGAAAWAPVEAALAEVEAWAAGGPAPPGAFASDTELGKALGGVLGDAERDADWARERVARGTRQVRAGAAAVLCPPADGPRVSEFAVEAARRAAEAVAQDPSWPGGGRTLSAEVVAARRAEGEAQAGIARDRLPLGAVLLARTAPAP